MSKESTSSKKKNRIKKNVLPVLVFIGGAFGGGFISGLIGKRAGLFDAVEDKSLPELLPLFLLYVGFAIAAIILQTVIHEAGHMVTGLLNGFRFFSYRVGPVMILKKDGKYSLKKYSIAGVLGQCLMEAPDAYDDIRPYVRYLYGGCFFNLLSAVICGLFFALTFIRRGNYHLLVFLGFMVLVGLVDVLTNGIPMKQGMVANDGYTIRCLRKDKSGTALRSLWLQLKVNVAQQGQNMRTKDMPAEWFAIPENLDMRNALSTTLLMYAAGRYMDEQDFENAEKMMDRLEGEDNDVIDIYRHMLKLDRLFLRILENGADTDLSVLEDKQVKTLMRSMKDHPSVIRTAYAVAKGVRHDEKEAATCLEQLEKVAKTWPNHADIESERELMELVR